MYTYDIIEIPNEKYIKCLHIFKPNGINIKVNHAENTTFI